MNLWDLGRKCTLSFTVKTRGELYKVKLKESTVPYLVNEKTMCYVHVVHGSLAVTRVSTVSRISGAEANSHLEVER